MPPPPVNRRMAILAMDITDRMPVSAEIAIESERKDSPRRHSAAEAQPKCGTAILAVTDSRAGSPCHGNRRLLRTNWRIVGQRSRRKTLQHP